MSRFLLWLKSWLPGWLIGRAAEPSLKVMAAISGVIKSEIRIAVAAAIQEAAARQAGGVKDQIGQQGLSINNRIAALEANVLHEQEKSRAVETRLCDIVEDLRVKLLVAPKCRPSRKRKPAKKRKRVRK